MSSNAHQVACRLPKQGVGGITFLVVGFILTALPFAVRNKETGRDTPWGWDDTLLIPSWICVMILSVLSVGKTPIAHHRAVHICCRHARQIF